MIVTGASAGPMDGELPMGISVTFSSACAAPTSSKTKKQINILFIISNRGGDTVNGILSSPHDLSKVIMSQDYTFPTDFIHFGCFFLASLSGIVPLTMILKVPGFARVPR